ncbi:hypothetical protein [Planctomycetes bacterium TBK1r]|uniref:Lipoprotein n=1 Tax=Stieleria magnilauensis TaxID=2527963 RepID=A0ABX5XVK2_9BACT|nr:hypothetical protein TBK1r_50010 [Planctomycetes bacterium TBK1r]
MRKLAFVLLIGILLSGCNGGDSDRSSIHSSESPAADATATAAAKSISDAEIRQLIEQLVFSHDDASNQPIINPNIKVVDSEGNAQLINGESEDAERRREKFNSCQEAFNKLYELKGASIPFLVEHLDDERQSINFRNHYTGNSVGDACFWNIYFQLQDRPRDYSRYGYSRKGRDGKDHPKPYWEGTPFDDAGGLKEWLEQNNGLNYVEMQIKCLQWLLDREKEIGAPDADSYFLDILPLEIRILERRLENGDDVTVELERLINLRDKKRVDQIPSGLLPEK